MCTRQLFEYTSTAGWAYHTFLRIRMSYVHHPHVHQRADALTLELSVSPKQYFHWWLSISYFSTRPQNTWASNKSANQKPHIYCIYWDDFQKFHWLHSHMPFLFWICQVKGKYSRSWLKLTVKVIRSWLRFVKVVKVVKVIRKKTHVPKHMCRKNAKAHVHLRAAVQKDSINNV